ncbi:MAG TPA: DNA primase [Thiotrichaceae bacterium]|jgi:hypothetical protein|nr:DNA primase [Thiotrichaceae bacterium]
MIADKLIHVLNGVRETGEGRWLACCPAHDDRSPSLSMREIDDRLLIHCFAGCDVNEVVNAVGLELSDLFPEKRTTKYNKSQRLYFKADDVLEALQDEITMLQKIAARMNISEFDERLALASQRFQSARDLI